MERRSFEDEICRNSYFIDIHEARKLTQEADNKAGAVEPRTIECYRLGESNGIPFRSLINVLVAGCSISLIDWFTEASE